MAAKSRGRCLSGDFLRYRLLVWFRFSDIRPFKADALNLLRIISVALLISVLPALSYSLTFSWGLFCYWLCGVVNSLFFAAVAARTEYAPAQGAGQIYMWVAAVKISAASMGAFIAGVMVDIGVLMPMVVSCVLAMGLLFCFFKAQNVETFGNILVQAFV